MWDKLYNAAVKVQNSRKISPFIDAGGVAAAILTKQGNIYVGVCIDTACTLGMCAERNAIANMITNGESRIDKVVAVMAPWASAQYRKMSAEDGYRAVAFALLMNTFMKYASKEYVYMPPTCSCATTAAPAAAAGVAFLHGLTPQQINDMLCTAQVQMAGVVCDGAKPSCATRMYVALFGSLQAMMMAKEGIRATNVEGFVHNDLKVTLENLYRLQHDVLHNKVDAILWDIVKEQKVIH